MTFPEPQDPSLVPALVTARPKPRAGFSATPRNQIEMLTEGFLKAVADCNYLQNAAFRSPTVQVHGTTFSELQGRKRWSFP